MLHLQSSDEVLQVEKHFNLDLTEIFALLSWIASGADNRGHTCCYLSQAAKGWGSLSIGPFWPRPNCVIGFLSGCGFTASYWECAYSMFFCLWVVHRAIVGCKSSFFTSCRTAIHPYVTHMHVLYLQANKQRCVISTYAETDTWLTGCGGPLRAGHL